MIGSEKNSETVTCPLYAPKVKFNSIGETESSINIDGVMALSVSTGAAGFPYTSAITSDSTVINVRSASVPTNGVAFKPLRSLVLSCTEIELALRMVASLSSTKL